MTRTDDTPVPDYASLVRLDGRRFVVLGAGQGIGRQVAARAATAVGARVACVDEVEDRAADIAAEVGGVPLAGNAYSRTTWHACSRKRSESSAASKASSTSSA